MGRIRLALALVMATAALARANGRFPQTMTLAFQPGDDQKIWVGSTFGLLYSPDDGATWYWLCETNLGYMGIYDPVFAVSSQGTIFESVYDGLRISRDGGCSFNLAGNGLDGTWIGAVQVAADDSVWISTTTTAMPNDVFVSRDDGVTFQSTALVRPRGFWKTLEVAPSDANRVYVSGYEMAEPVDAAGAPTPLLFRTDNATAAPADIVWTQLAWGEGGESQLKLIGVSRADPDIVFVRVDEEPTDRVYRSDDGGAGWNHILDFMNDDATAFASSADGMTIVIGSAYAGVKISTDAGVTWNDAPAGTPQMFCAGIRPADNDFFACGANWEPDMKAIGRSTDLATWEKVFRFVEIDGALDCPAGTPQGDTCEAIWCNTCDMFGCPDPVCGGVIPDARPAGDGGTDCAATNSCKDSKCGCVVGGRAGVLGTLVGLSLVAGVASAWRLSRRRRRR